MSMKTSLLLSNVIDADHQNFALQIWTFNEVLAYVHIYNFSNGSN